MLISSSERRLGVEMELLLADVDADDGLGCRCGRVLDKLHLGLLLDCSTAGDARSLVRIGARRRLEGEPPSLMLVRLIVGSAGATRRFARRRR